jgi:hypothetical protein
MMLFWLAILLELEYEASVNQTAWMLGSEKFRSDNSSGFGVFWRGDRCARRGFKPFFIQAQIKFAGFISQSVGPHLWSCFHHGLNGTIFDQD